MKSTRLKLGVLLSAGRPRYRGELTGFPVDRDVEILYDRWSIPHLFAESEHDLMVAQGFVQAQDRLWQMELFRRLASGRLAEIAGEEMVDLDHFSLLAGFGRLRDRSLHSLTGRDRANLAAFVEGINAYLRSPAFHLPVELGGLHANVREWRVEDTAGVLPVNGWFLQANYQEELAALLARDRLDAESFNELYPSTPGARLPRERFFERFRGVQVGELLPAAVALYPELGRLAGPAAASADAGRSTVAGRGARESAAPKAAGKGAGLMGAGGGSNNWVVRNGEGGLPLVANDPHLGVMVPQVWHLIHLHCPTLNCAGFAMAGVPGIILGRNEKVAWGFTNLQTDMVDLYLYHLDPADRGRYLAGGKSLPLEGESVEIPVAGKSARRVTIHRTIEGPLITEIPPEGGAVAALKWYGTLGDDLEDTTVHGILDLARSRSVDELFETARSIKTIGQNIVAGDAAGNIGWHTIGLVPIRSGYSGRTPADGSTGAQRWSGFLPYDRMPSSTNPPSGRIATANNRVQPPDAETPITYAWNALYRHERIASLLEPLEKATIRDFRAIQMDVYSLQAERLLPALLGRRYADPRAVEAARILEGWDRVATPRSAGALVFSVFLTELLTLLAEPLLGKALPLYTSVQPFFHNVVDSLLTGGKAAKVLEAAGFAGTESRGASAGLGSVVADAAAGVGQIDAGAASDGLDAVGRACEAALCRAVDFLERSLGPNRRAWRWGRLHTYLFAHTGGTTPFTRWLLNRGPYPAGGTSTTVNVALWSAAAGGGARERYRVVTIPSMRFIASLASPDETIVWAPMGQSGRPGARHYDDMVRGFLRGEMARLPLTHAGARRIVRSRLVLKAPQADPAVPH